MISNGQTMEGILQGISFLASMSPEHLKIISQGAEIKEFQADDILFQQGKSAYRMFLILSGKVALEVQSEVSRGEQICVEKLGVGDVFGWSFLVPPFCWHLQARALEPTKVIVLDGAHLVVSCEDDPTFGYAFMKRVAQLIAHRFQSLRKKLVEEHECNLKEEIVGGE